MSCVNTLSVFTTRIKSSSETLTTLTACQPVYVYAQDALTWWVEISQAHRGEGNSGFVKASTALGVAK